MCIRSQFHPYGELLTKMRSYSTAQTENAKSVSFQGLSQCGINEKFVCIRGRSLKQHGHDRQEIENRHFHMSLLSNSGPYTVGVQV
jgi:hypothetical protein